MAALLRIACALAAAASVSGITLSHLPRQLEISPRSVEFIARNRTISSEDLKRGRRQISRRGSCKVGEFQCTDRTCIEFDQACDGAVDCPDKSDESHALCQHMGCHSRLFKCSYGACVDGSAKCNGVQDCADYSDELHKDCSKKPTVTKKCKGYTFQCDNGQCIEGDTLCDGAVDCADGSDETLTQCSAMTCKSFLVRCAYGACVDGGSKCNNVPECADKSDEDPLLCSAVPGWVAQPPAPPAPTTAPPTTARPPPPVLPTPDPSGSGAGCVLPPFPVGGSYMQEGSKQPLQPGATAPDLTVIRYSCSKDSEVSNEISYCLETQWIPPSVLCRKKCTMVTSYTVDFECFTPTFSNIPCRDKMSHGSIVQTRCKHGHSIIDFLDTLKCIDGSWDNPTPRCKPECGREKGLAVTHIVNGQAAPADSFPWHVGIYRVYGDSEILQECGGSLLHSHIVITAAHCFWDNDNNAPLPAANYRVAGGKYYRSWDSEFEKNLQAVSRSEVAKLIVHDNYGGAEFNHQSDLAILTLKTPFKLSNSIVPVCYDLYNEQFNTAQTSADSYGKVAGWGKTQSDGQPSETLKTLSMPVIDLQACRIELSKYQFQRSLTIDKMCGGYLNGSALCQGDSGGGLVFPIQDVTNITQWYLRGVVSNGPVDPQSGSCRVGTYTAFTQIFKLRDWLNKQLRMLV